MQAVQADITACFWDNTDGVGTGTALLHLHGTVPPVAGVITTTPGALNPKPSDNVIMCNATTKTVTTQRLPFGKTTAILATEHPTCRRIIQTAAKGGRLDIEGDKRPWIERMTALLGHAQGTTDEQFIGIIDMPLHGEVAAVIEFLSEHDEELRDAFSVAGDHVLLVNATCSETHYMVWDDYGVSYSTDSVKRKILAKLAPFSETYHTTLSDAVACLFGTAHVGSEYAHCWLELPISHDAVRSVLPYSTASAGVNSESVCYSRTNKGLTFSAKAGHFWITIVLEATSEIKESLPPGRKANKDVDIVMQLLAARTDEQVGYPYFAFVQRRDGMNASRDPFVKMMCNIADQRKLELDRDRGIVSYMQTSSRIAGNMLMPRHASEGFQ